MEELLSHLAEVLPQTFRYEMTKRRDGGFMLWLTNGKDAEATGDTSWTDVEMASLCFLLLDDLEQRGWHVRLWAYTRGAKQYVCERRIDYRSFTYPWEGGTGATRTEAIVRCYIEAAKTPV
jgi:hypothetical protein